MAIEQAQDAALATDASSLEKNDGLVPWRLDARAVCNFIRGMTPWPGAFTFRHPAAGGQAERLIVLSAQVEEASNSGVAPGTLLRAEAAPLIACGRGCLRLLQVKPEGSRPMEAAAWLRGYSVQPGDQFRGET